MITVNQDGITPYTGWEMCNSTEPRFCHLATGVSGVIYHPDFLIALKMAGTRFLDCCPKADDIWLHVQALRAGYKIRQIGQRGIHFPTIPGTQTVSLYSSNVLHHDGNDRQVKSTYTDADLAILAGDGASPMHSAAEAVGRFYIESNVERRRRGLSAGDTSYFRSVPTI